MDCTKDICNILKYVAKLEMQKMFLETKTPYINQNNDISMINEKISYCYNIYHTLKIVDSN